MLEFDIPTWEGNASSGAPGVEWSPVMVEQHIRGYRDLLAELISRSGRSKKQIAEQLGWSDGAVTRVVQGSRELKLRHLLSILEVLEVEPIDFFLLAHPARKGDPGRALSARVLGQFEREGERPPLVLPVLSEEELEQRIEEVVRRVLKEPDSY